MGPPGNGDVPLIPKLVLCDLDPQILDIWRQLFLKRPEVEIRELDPLQTTADAFLLPGNSFGFLDSGLDLRVLETAGFGLQDDLRKIIREEFAGELLVGQAIALRSSNLPWLLIYAPIWRTPSALADTVNVFLATRGAYMALLSQGPISRRATIPFRCRQDRRRRLTSAQGAPAERS